MALTEAQLDLLGRRPSEALRRWPALNGTQKWTVVMAMGRYYDLNFASHFNQFAVAGTKSATSVHITNDPSITPASLTSAGYRKAGNAGGAQLWVHPSGREVWVLSPPKGAPTPPPTPPEDPDVEDATKKLAEMEAKAKELKNRFQRLTQSRGGPQWAREAVELLLDYQAFTTAGADVMKHDFEYWMEDQSPANYAKLQDLKSRMFKTTFESVDPAMQWQIIDELKKWDPNNDLYKAAMRRRGLDPEAPAPN